MDFVRTGVFATTEELNELAAMPTTTIWSGLTPFIPKDPQQEFYERVYTLALAHGLPSVEGFYGVDKSSGEFLTVPAG